MTIPTPFRPTGSGTLYTFVQPSLSANGTWGGPKMAVRGVNEPIGSLAAWQSFFAEPLDTNKTECYLFRRDAGVESYLDIWYPHGLIVRSIDFVNSYYSLVAHVKTFSVIGTTADGASINMGHYPVGSGGNNARWSITLPEYSTPCTAIRFIFTSTNPETGQVRFAKVFLSAFTTISPEQQAALQQ